METAAAVAAAWAEEEAIINAYARTKLAMQINDRSADFY